MVVVAVVESFGGINAPLMRRLKSNARRASRKNGRDATRYSRTRPVPYITHHTRAISAAAVLTCAANTEKEYMAIKIAHAARSA